MLDKWRKSRFLKGLIAVLFVGFLTVHAVREPVDDHQQPDQQVDGKSPKTEGSPDVALGRGSGIENGPKVDLSGSSENVDHAVERQSSPADRGALASLCLPESGDPAAFAISFGSEHQVLSQDEVSSQYLTEFQTRFLQDWADDLTAPQLDAVEKLAERCADWLNHEVSQTDVTQLRDAQSRHRAALSQTVDSLGESSQHSAASEAHLLEQLGPVFYEGEAFSSSNAVAILLESSVSFQSTLAATVGSVNADYVQTGASDISLLYGCRLAGDCSSDSAFALTACMGDPRYCNRSVESAVQSMHSLNYADDLFTIADVLYRARLGDIEVIDLGRDDG